jgi:hypothetical protein
VKIVTVGIDLAKKIFAEQGVNSTGKPHELRASLPVLRHWHGSLPRRTLICLHEAAPNVVLVFQRASSLKKVFSMARQRFSVEQMAAALKQVELGMPADVIRRTGISDANVLPMEEAVRQHADHPWLSSNALCRTG